MNSSPPNVTQLFRPSRKTDDNSAENQLPDSTKSKSSDQRLRGGSESAIQVRLSQALNEYYAIVDAGDRPDRDLLLQKYSDVAEELTSCLETFDFVNNVAPQLADPPDSTASNVSPQAAAPRPATLGEFQILRELGRGGMGVVYEVEQISLGRRMALKVLPFAAMLDKQQLKRFKNEARAAATLDHPNIVAVHSVGEQRGVHYYAMQLIEGQSLAEVISEMRADRPESREEAPLVSRESNAEHGPQDPHSSIPHSPFDTDVIAALSTIRTTNPKRYFRRVAELGIQAARALDHAHQHGILHRDVKPGNLLLDDEGKLYVTDFGLARIESGASMTITGDVLGTLAYMSPEQALAKRVVVDHRTDVYSLGVTLYELLTLTQPYTGTDRQDLLKKIAFDEPRRPRQINRNIPGELETIVRKALEKNPDDRFAAANELADDLDRFLSDEPIQARAPNLRQRVVKWSRRHAPIVGSIATVALVLVVVMAWLASAQINKRATVAAAVESSLKQAREAMAVDATDLAQIAVTQALTEAGEISNTKLQDQVESLRHEISRYEEFVEIYDEARYRGGRTAESALEVYGVLQDEQWRDAIGQSTAPTAFIERVDERIFEMLLLLAYQEVRFPIAENVDASRVVRNIEKARAMLEHASERRAPSKLYYWIQAACAQHMGDLTGGDVRDAYDIEALQLRRLADQTPPLNASDLFYISNDRRHGCASQHARQPFQRPYAEGELLADYRQMLRLEPAYLNALQFTGHHLANSDRPEAALEAFNAILSHVPNNIGRLINRAEVLQQLGLYEESLIDLQRALVLARNAFTQNPDSDYSRELLSYALYCTARYTQRSRDQEAARPLWREALEISNLMVGEAPGDDRLLVDRDWLIDGFSKFRSHDDVRKLIEEAADRARRSFGDNSPTTMVSMQLLAEWLRQQGNFQQAYTLSERVGKTAMLAMQPEIATESFLMSRRAANTLTQRTRSSLLLAMAKWRLAQTDQKYAELSEACGILAKAIDAIGNDTHDADAVRLRDEAKYLISHEQTAQLMLSLSDKISSVSGHSDPSPVARDIRLARARIYAANKSWGRAANDWACVLDNAGDTREHFDSPIERACRELAAWPEVFHRVAKLRPEQSTLWIGRGQYLVQRSKWKEAARDYGKAYASRRLDDDTVFEYAGSLLLVGDRSGYERICSKLAQDYAEHGDSFARYITTRCCAAGKSRAIAPEQLVAWASERLEEDHRPWVSHLLGLAQYRARKFREALKSLEESNSDRWWPRRSKALNSFVLAMVHHRLGNHDEARDWLRRGRLTVTVEGPKVSGEPTNVFVPDWVEMELLRREAEAMFAEDEASTAQQGTKVHVENDQEKETR